MRLGNENFIAAVASLIPVGSSSRSSAISFLELSGSTRRRNERHRNGCYVSGIFFKPYVNVLGLLLIMYVLK